MKWCIVTVFLIWAAAAVAGLVYFEPTLSVAGRSAGDAVVFNVRMTINKKGVVDKVVGPKPAAYQTLEAEESQG